MGVGPENWNHISLPYRKHKGRKERGSVLRQAETDRQRDTKREGSRVKP